MTIATTFWEQYTPEPNTGCWLWLRALDTHGYGHFNLDGKDMLAHRHAFVEVRGPIPSDMVLDHRCRTRSCINPAHLEVVTQRTNIMRGRSPGALAVATGRCKRGHLLAGPNAAPSSWGGRYCRLCNLARCDRKRGSKPPKYQKASRVLLERWAKENP